MFRVLVSNLQNMVWLNWGKSRQETWLYTWFVICLWQEPTFCAILPWKNREKICYVLWFGVKYEIMGPELPQEFWYFKSSASKFNVYIGLEECRLWHDPNMITSELSEFMAIETVRCTSMQALRLFLRDWSVGGLGQCKAEYSWHTAVPVTPNEIDYVADGRNGWN